MASRTEEAPVAAEVKAEVKDEQDAGADAGAGAGDGERHWRRGAATAAAAYKAWVVQENKAAAEKNAAYTAYTHEFANDHPVVYLLVEIGRPNPESTTGRALAPGIVGLYTTANKAAAKANLSLITEKRYQCVVPVPCTYVVDYGLLRVFTPDARPGDKRRNLLLESKYALR